MNLQKIKKILKNKKILVILILIVVLSTYFIFKSMTGKQNKTVYTTATITKGTLISSISGSGQVVSLEELAIKTKISGEVSYLNLKNGQKVNRGDLLLQLDNVEAQKEVWNAKIALENAKLSSKDLAKESNDSLKTIANNILNAINTNYKDLATHFPNIDNMFTESSYNSADDENDVDYYLRLVKFIQKNNNIDIDLSYWTKTAEAQYEDLKGEYEIVQTKSWFLNNQSSINEVKKALDESYENNKKLLDFTRQTISLTKKYQYILTTNNIISPIPTAVTNTQVDYLTNLNSVLVANTNALNALKGSLDDALDSDKKVGVSSETQDLTIREKELDLKTANTNFNNHFVYAPFSGILTSVNDQIKIGDEIANGTELATIVTNQQIAEITLNEVDVAKVKIGQKANITFDAIPDLTLTGKVIEVDEIGTIDQGVVTYGVKIEFDSQNDQIKQGMSLSANIITDIKTDTYLINNSAIKEQNNTYYVEVLNADQTITQKTVIIGATDDMQTEIISGIDEKDNVVIKSTNGNTAKTTPTGFGMPMGNNMRMR